MYMVYLDLSNAVGFSVCKSKYVLVCIPAFVEILDHAVIITLHLARFILYTQPMTA